MNRTVSYAHAAYEYDTAEDPSLAEDEAPSSDNYWNGLDEYDTED